MKIGLTILLLINFISIINAQENKGIITLYQNVTLEYASEKFIPENHKIETCKSEFGYKFICKIDGKIWFGGDIGMENPRNQLTKLVLKINSITVDLDISNMFNPSYDGGLSKKHFLFKKEGEFYKLYSFFSDGAGTYTVHWKILGNSSVREVISGNERFFYWQNERE